MLGWIALAAALVGGVLTAVLGNAKPFSVSLFFALALCLLLVSGIPASLVCREALSSARLEKVAHHRGTAWAYFSYRYDARHYTRQGACNMLSQREYREFFPGELREVYVWPRFPGVFVTRRSPCFCDFLYLLGTLFFAAVGVGVWVWG